MDSEKLSSTNARIFILSILLSIGLFASVIFSWLTPIPLFYISRRFSLASGFFFWALFYSLLAGLYYAFSRYFPDSSSGAELLPGVLGLSKAEVFGLKPLWLLFVYTVFYGCIGLLMAWRIRKNRSLFSLCAWVLGGTCFITFLSLLIASRANLQNLIGGMDHTLGVFLDEVIKSSGQSGDDFTLLLQESKKEIIRLLPGSFVAFTLFLIALNLSVMRRLFRYLGYFDQTQTFETVHFPFSFVWVTLGLLGCYLFNNYFSKIEFIHYSCWNFFIVLIALYFFQGLAIIHFYSLLKGIAPWIRFTFYLLLFLFMQPLSLLIAALGFFDSWFNLRKLKLNSAS